MLCAQGNAVKVRNLEGVRECELLGKHEGDLPDPDKRESRRVVLEVRNVRNALERVSMHFTHLRKEGARRIFAFITFGLFAKGYQMFKDAYEQGIFDKMFVTNLTYIPQEIVDQPWFCHVNMCKYTAYVIDAINQDRSVGAIIDPKQKIDKLLARHREELSNRD